MDRARKALGDVTYDTQIKLDDSVGQRLDPFSPGLQFRQGIFIPEQGLHAFEQQHEDVVGYVFTVATGKACFHTLVENGIIDVSPAVVIQSTPLLQRVYFHLAHVGNLGTHPAATSFIECQALILITDTDLVPLHKVDIADA